MCGLCTFGYHAQCTCCSMVHHQPSALSLEKKEKKEKNKANRWKFQTPRHSLPRQKLTEPRSRPSCHHSFMYTPQHTHTPWIAVSIYISPSIYWFKVTYLKLLWLSHRCHRRWHLSRQHHRHHRRLCNQACRFGVRDAGWSWRWALVWRSSCARRVRCHKCCLRSWWKGPSKTVAAFSTKRRRRRRNKCRRTASIRQRSSFPALIARPFLMCLMAYLGSRAHSVSLILPSICPKLVSSFLRRDRHRYLFLLLLLLLPRKSTRFFIHFSLSLISSCICFL